MLTDSYTVPADTATILSTIVLTNQNPYSTKVRVSHSWGGAADAREQYLVYDMNLRGRESLGLTFGITLAETDVIRVYSQLGGVSFNIYGVEQS